MEGCRGCLDGIRALLGKPVDPEDMRTDFEQVVTFLASVPLFRKQLPKSELPKVAQNLKRKVWQPGEKLVQQGEMGRAFFLIEAGKALVVTATKGEPDRVRASLVAGDYFGGHTLTTDRPNVASVFAGGNEPLVTLSMSRKAFEETGLRNWLQFPKRPAIYQDAPAAGERGRAVSKVGEEVTENSDLTSEETCMIKKAVKNNVNLRSLMAHNAPGSNEDEKDLDHVAAAAERREVPKGTVVANCGEVGWEFFIIGSGEVEVDFNDAPSSGQQSAEAAVQQSSMAERLMRKQHFLQGLAQPVGPSLVARTASVNVATIMRSRQESGKKQENLPTSPLVLAEPRTMFFRTESGSGPKPKRGQHQGQQVSSKSLKHNLGGRSQTAGLLEVGDKSSVVFESGSAHGSGAGVIPEGEAKDQITYGSHTDQDGDCDDYALPPSGEALQQPEGIRNSSSLGLAEGSPEPPMTLSAGDSFGELSLLYNTRREATFRTLQDSVLYSVHRKHFAALHRKVGGGGATAENIQLLEEVRALSALLSSERYELACNTTGIVTFAPCERILTQNKVRRGPLWYVIMSGTATMSQQDPDSTGLRQMADLQRADHFGERSLLRGDDFSQVNVDAGEFGLTCLTFNGNAIRPVLEAVFNSGFGCPPPSCGVNEWCKWKESQGFNRTVSVACDTRVSHGTGGATLDRLQKVCHLGRGGWGQVTLVQDPDTQKKYALKTMSKGFIKQEGAERLISWERELLSMVRSPFVIRLHRTLSDEQHIHFLLEAALGGSVMDVLRSNPEVFTEDTPRGSSCAFYVACLTAAIEHLHERSIAHRDLKPENALLDERGYAKLCDMGFARFILGKTNTLVGTPDYMAPEMIDFPHQHDKSVDWYSLGVLSYELLAGQTPWEDEGIAEPMGRLLAIRRSQEKGIVSYPFHFPSICKDFVNRLLQKLPNRMGAKTGAEEVRGHAMYRSLRFDFNVFSERGMDAPLTKEFNTDFTLVTDDLGMDRGDLGLDPKDSLFIPYKDDGTGWDKDFYVMHRSDTYHVNDPGPGTSF